MAKWSNIMTFKRQKFDEQCLIILPGLKYAIFPQITGGRQILSSSLFCHVKVISILDLFSFPCPLQAIRYTSLGEIYPSFIAQITGKHWHKVCFLRSWPNDQNIVLPIIWNLLLKQCMNEWPWLIILNKQNSFRDVSEIREHCVSSCPNDQTLLVKTLKSACQAKFLTVWPRPKTLLVQHFCLHLAKNVFPLCISKTFCNKVSLQRDVLWPDQTVKHCLRS